MKMKRIVSLLLTATLAVSSLPICIAANGDAFGTQTSESDDVIMLDSGWKAGSTEASFITDTDGDGKKNENGDNEYIHVDNSIPSSDKVAGGAYTDTVTLPAGKTYRFSVWMRSTPTYKAGSKVENTLGLFLGYQYGSNHLFKVGTNNKIKVLAVSTDGVDSATGNVTLTDKWVKYTSVFTTLEEVLFRAEGVIHGGIIFRAVDSTVGDGSPFDVDGLSLYEAALTVDGYAPVAGANNILSDSTSNWANHNQWYSAGAQREARSENPFHSIKLASANTAVAYIPDADDELEPGVYELSGDFRLGELYWDEWVNSPAGGNEAKLTVSVGSEISDAMTVTTAWTNAKFAFEVIKGALSGEGGASKGDFVLATVKGDIHDIGKNIVKLLLQNYGYNVIDLGKDVAPAAIVEKVVELKARALGLSALMTTTVPAMEETIALIKEKAPWCRVVVGGAVLTADYAEKIGADRYAPDALEAVRFAEEIFG